MSKPRRRPTAQPDFYRPEKSDTYANTMRYAHGLYERLSWECLEHGEPLDTDPALAELRQIICSAHVEKKINVSALVRVAETTNPERNKTNG